MEECSCLTVTEELAGFFLLLFFGLRDEGEVEMR